MYKDKEESKAYAREYRQKLKEDGWCVECRKRRAEVNKTKCEFCAERARERHRKYREANKERIAQKSKELRERYKAEGRCQACGKPQYGGTTFCYECALKRRNRIRRVREQERIARNPEQEALHNAIVKQKRREAALKRNENQDNRNHIWRKLNRLIFL